MSTPSVTILKNLVLNWKSNQMEEETIATFYRHWDGYPSCHAIDIANSLIVASRTKPEHIDFSGASVERGILNNRNWCQHFLKAMCMADADIEFIGEDNVPSASYTYVVTGAYDNFGGKEILGAEEYLSRINIKVYEGDENGNLVFEGGAAECLACFFQSKGDALQSGERYCLKLDTEEMVVGVDDALRNVTSQNNIQGSYSYGDVY